MGPYLSQPKTEKESVKGENGTITYGATHMQGNNDKYSGWRNTMEDAHISELDIDPGVSLFAVFDGHGGREVAVYAELHFKEELKKNPNYKSQNYKQALTETFMRIDRLLTEPDG
jgi:serine/threonine protein phosphatase PrpC